jgi:DHA1 family bicyclomycin/chloramphenicol resistance-like MFS transporter
MLVQSQRQMAAIAVLLGLITLVGSASIDMYLPFIPAMAAEIGTDYASMQVTLMVFLIATGGGQLIFGPLIDAVGRRVPLLLALAIFVVASLIASQSTSLTGLVAARALQGLACATAMVTAFSTVRDVTTGARAAQLFALLMTIQGLGPVVMPVVGGVVGSLFDWRAIFIALAILGVIVFFTSLIWLRETLPADQRTPFKPRAIWGSYVNIFQDRSYLLAGLALTLTYVFIFAYVAGAAHVYQILYGVSAQTFGFIFGATGIALFIGAVGSAKLVTMMKVQHIALGATILMLLGSIIALTGLMPAIGLHGIVAGMFIAVIGLGAAEATLLSIALSTRETAIGTAAALLGAVPLCVGALATPIAAYFAEMGTLEWIMMLIVSGAASAVLAWASARKVSQSGVTVSLQH